MEYELRFLIEEILKTIREDEYSGDTIIDCTKMKEVHKLALELKAYLPEVK